MSINLRFQQIINEFYAGNKRAFSMAIGVSATVVENVVGKRQGNPSFELSEKLLNALGQIDPQWLMTGKGKMVKDMGYQIDDRAKEVAEDSPIYKASSKGDIAISVYNVDLVTEYASLFDGSLQSQQKVGEIRIPNMPKCDAAVTVRGDSMYPILNSGDIVCYKVISDPLGIIFWGEMYLIYLEMDGEEFLTIRYIQKSEKGDKYLLLGSHNTSHQTIHALRSDIKALGLVKACIRYNGIR